MSAASRRTGTPGRSARTRTGRSSQRLGIEDRPRPVLARGGASAADEGEPAPQLDGHRVVVPPGVEDDGGPRGTGAEGARPCVQGADLVVRRRPREGVEGDRAGGRRGGLLQHLHRLLHVLPRRLVGVAERIGELAVGLAARRDERSRGEEGREEDGLRARDEDANHRRQHGRGLLVRTTVRHGLRNRPVVSCPAACHCWRVSSEFHQK